MIKPVLSPQQKERILQEIKRDHENHIRCVMCGHLAVAYAEETGEPLCFRCLQNNKEARFKK